MVGSTAAAAALIRPPESHGIVAQREERRGGRVAGFVEVNGFGEILQQFPFFNNSFCVCLEPILNISV